MKEKKKLQIIGKLPGAKKFENLKNYVPNIAFVHN